MPSPQNRRLRWLSLPLLLVLAGCGAPPETPPPEPTGTAPADVVDSAAVAPPPAVAAPPLAQLRSEQSPFACDVVTADDVKAIFGADVTIRDVTAQRESYSLVDSICQFDFDPAKPFTLDGRPFNGVRVSVFTDRGLRKLDAGSLQDQWQHRTRYDEHSFQLEGGIRAAWVDSEHPPDQSLLVRLGEVMLEVGYYPPASFRGSPQANAPIERLATLMLTNMQERLP